MTKLGFLVFLICIAGSLWPVFHHLQREAPLEAKAARVRWYGVAFCAVVYFAALLVFKGMPKGWTSDNPGDHSDCCWAFQFRFFCSFVSSRIFAVDRGALV